MKKIYFVLLMCATLNGLYAQSWISSSRITGTSDVSELTSEIDNNGNVYSFGYFEGSLSVSADTTIDSYGDRDYFLIKFLPGGEVDWMRSFGNVLNDYVYGGLGFDSENNVYVTGGFQGYLKYSDTDSVESTGILDIFLLKCNEGGDVMWARNVGMGASLQYSTSLHIDQNDSIILSGNFKNDIIFNDSVSITSEYTNNVFYAKFNSSAGDLLWAKYGKAITGDQGYYLDIESDPASYFFTGFFIDSLGFESDTIVTGKTGNNVFLIKTNQLGDILWHRTISGNSTESCYSIVNDEDNSIYAAGYYNSDTIVIDSDDSQSIEVTERSGQYDLFILKYLSDGSLDWVRTVGGKGDDRVYGLEYFNQRIHLAGVISDTIDWGGITLTTNSTSDRDMFTGALDKQGFFREANSYSGIANSTDEARAIFQNGDQLYTVLRTNSALLVLGDSIYVSSGDYFYLALGVIGCLPISIDNVIIQDVSGCYGDSTGSLQILASEGFGAPWLYSIDNGETSSEIAYFGDLPAGDYPIVVIDKEGCVHEGNVETIGQPDSLILILESYDSISNDSDATLEVTASGGTMPYTYTLKPGDVVQGFGTYTFSPGEEGWYWVEVDDGNNCGPVASDTVEIKSTVNVDDSDAFGVKLYPNPTSGMITLEMPFERSEGTMEILSLTGQVMIKRHIYSSGGMINETIDMSDLAKGMYMLRMNDRILQNRIVVH